MRPATAEEAAMTGLPFEAPLMAQQRQQASMGRSPIASKRPQDSRTQTPGIGRSQPASSASGDEGYPLAHRQTRQTCEHWRVVACSSSHPNGAKGNYPSRDRWQGHPRRAVGDGPRADQGRGRQTKRPRAAAFPLFSHRHHQSE
jgi:hypothetical protein